MGTRSRLGVLVPAHVLQALRDQSHDVPVLWKVLSLQQYMNYKLGGEGRGYFNTPGVLMANAAIHAWGGAHLELGEHMLTSNNR